MTIYIEYFLLQNIIINFCLLRLVKITLKPNSSFFKLFLSSLLGAGFSIICAIFITNNTAMNILKICCGLTMILIAFKQSKKGIISSFILLLIYTYAFGGIITSLSSTTYSTSFGVVASIKINLWAICAILIIATYIIEILANHLKIKTQSSNYIYELTLKQNNKTITINAYLDTGNLLNHNGKPVIIIDLSTYLKLTNSNLINFYLSNTETIQTGTVTGSNNLKLFTIEKAIIKHNKKKIELTEQYVAVNSTVHFKNTNYQALISPFLF